MYQKREPGGRNFRFWYPRFQSVVKCHIQSLWAPSQLRASKIFFGLSMAFYRWYMAGKGGTTLIAYDRN